jgi:hypothetical protein
VRGDEKLSAFVELERDVLTVMFISNPFKPIRASERDSLRSGTWTSIIFAAGGCGWLLFAHKQFGRFVASARNCS